MFCALSLSSVILSPRGHPCVNVCFAFFASFPCIFILECARRFCVWEKNRSPLSFEGWNDDDAGFPLFALPCHYVVVFAGYSNGLFMSCLSLSIFRNISSLFFVSLILPFLLECSSPKDETDSGLAVSIIFYDVNCLSCCHLPFHDRRLTVLLWERRILEL